ncbi:MAG: efflux RND transporter periplasmic adaptor subunit [Shinella sp.]|nr:efflux RND transporter periplasmic adaptor subunit [Shinella sp.]
MKPGTFILVTTVVAAVGAGSYAAGNRGMGRDYLAQFVAIPTASLAQRKPPTGKVIYYKHPDGVPEYSAGPKQTSDGRPFVEVRESEDVSLDPVQPEPEKAEAEGERKVLYYRNPMGLPDTSPLPKKDSMGMDYLPVYEGEQPEPGELRVPLGKLQRSGVRTAKVERQAIERKIRVPGVVQFDERRIQVVSMRTDAFIDEVANVTTGDQIKKGDRLFSFYSGEIARAAAEFAASIRNGTGGDLANGVGLQLRNLGVPDETIKVIARERAVPRSLQYVSPIDGVVLERPALPGMMAEAGDALFRIVDNSAIWVIADVPEYDLAAIKVGQPAHVTFSNFPGREVRGKVGLVYPGLQTQTRTAKIRIEVPNSDGRLLADMFAEVEIDVGGAALVVAVPSSSIIDTGSRQIVFLDKGEGRFEARDVKLGARGAELTEVTEGIAPGDTVVSSGNFLLDAESNLTSALNAVATQEIEP